MGDRTIGRPQHALPIAPLFVNDHADLACGYDYKGGTHCRRSTTWGPDEPQNADRRRIRVAPSRAALVPPAAKRVADTATDTPSGAPSDTPSHARGEALGDANARGQRPATSENTVTKFTAIFRLHVPCSFMTRPTADECPPSLGSCQSVNKSTPSFSAIRPPRWCTPIETPMELLPLFHDS